MGTTRQSSLVRFAARIPTVPQSVELIQLATADHVNRYRCFAGESMAAIRLNTPEAAKQRNFILGLGSGTPAQ